MPSYRARNVSETTTKGKYRPTKDGDQKSTREKREQSKGILLILLSPSIGGDSSCGHFPPRRSACIIPIVSPFGIPYIIVILRRFIGLAGPSHFQKKPRPNIRPSVYQFNVFVGQSPIIRRYELRETVILLNKQQMEKQFLLRAVEGNDARWDLHTQGLSLTGCTFLGSKPEGDDILQNTDYHQTQLCFFLCAGSSVLFRSRP